MKELLLIIVSSALVNNVVLSQFMGLCPFLGVSKTTDTAAGMGGAVIFVITLSSFVTSVIYKLILQPLDLTYLQTIVFILIIAALVQFVEMFLKKSIKVTLVGSSASCFRKSPASFSSPPTSTVQLTIPCRSNADAWLGRKIRFLLTWNRDYRRYGLFRL